MTFTKKFVPTAAVDADFVVLAAASIVAAASPFICLGRRTVRILGLIRLPFLALNDDRSSISMTSSGSSPCDMDRGLLKIMSN